MFADYAAEPGQLWRGVHHDRNGHFNFGLDLALALKALDPLAFLQQIERSRVWPPVHGLALASVMMLGGIDMRLAILPSLIGWICTIVLAFLTAQRLFADPLTGTIAGAITVTFALASPAFRMITADVMLEGLGAALTAICLYVYLRARAEPDRRCWWGALALALTVLFFEKSNYWVITIVPLAVASLWEDPRRWLIWCRTQFATIDMAGIFRRAARDPFVFAVVAFVLLVTAIYARGPTAVDIFGRRVSLYPPENLATITWCVLFIRAMTLWRKHRAAFDAALGLPMRRLFYWHALPIAVSFLLPKRFATFLWYVGPTHFAEVGSAYRPMQALASQWLAFSQGFHVVPWIAALVLALAIISATQLPRLAPGALAIAILAALSAAAVVLHPQQQWRFQTTWLFAIWILAGAGGAIILLWLTGRLPGIIRGVVASAAIATIAASESRYAWTDVAYAAAIHPRSGPSDLDLAKAYLPHVSSARVIGFMATFPGTAFFAWSVREHCRCPATVVMPWLSSFQTREEYRRITADWLAHTHAERIVSIEAPALYAIPSLGLTSERLSGVIDAIANDPGFERIATEPVPTLGATVTIWRRL